MNDQLRGPAIRVPKITYNGSIHLMLNVPQVRLTCLLWLFLSRAVSHWTTGPLDHQKPAASGAT